METSTGETYGWPAESTDIQNPAYFRDMSTDKGTIQNIVRAKVLLILSDMVTTDHISPAGSLKPDTPAGEYLTRHGNPVREFNSYGARRGNHEVMMRGTFANIRIRNEMLDGVEGGFTKGPNGEQTTVFDASMAYQAQGANLLGVKAVIAGSFERIHRSNLVGMGEVPFEFTEGDTRKTLNLTGDETVTIRGLDSVKPLQFLECDITYGDETTKTVKLKCRIDTAPEIDYLENGGVLHYILRNLAKS